DRDESGTAILGLHLDLDGFEGPEMSVLAHEPPGVDGILPAASFLMRQGNTEDVRPLRPGVRGGARVGRARNDLELVHALAALAMHGAQAVGAGVAAADDDHMLV